MSPSPSHNFSFETQSPVRRTAYHNFGPGGTKHESINQKEEFSTGFSNNLTRHLFNDFYNSLWEFLVTSRQECLSSTIACIFFFLNFLQEFHQKLFPKLSSDINPKISSGVTVIFYGFPLRISFKISTRIQPAFYQEASQKLFTRLHKKSGISSVKPHIFRNYSRRFYVFQEFIHSSIKLFLQFSIIFF